MNNYVFTLLLTYIYVCTYIYTYSISYLRELYKCFIIVLSIALNLKVCQLHRLVCNFAKWRKRTRNTFPSQSVRPYIVWLLKVTKIITQNENMTLMKVSINLAVWAHAPEFAYRVFIQAIEQLKSELKTLGAFAWTFEIFIYSFVALILLQALENNHKTYCEITHFFNWNILNNGLKR